MNKNFMKTLARKHALQVLYALDINPEADAELNDTVTMRVEGDNLAFSESLVNTVQEHLSEIDRIISAHLRRWSIDQLNVVDKCILRIGIAELLFAEKQHADKGIIINDAVVMAKEFGGESSYRFINGVLNAVSDEYHKS